MSWAEVKKINDNLSISLDQLLIQFLAGGFREYIYESKQYVIPFDGTYTIRAYNGGVGSYGKVVKNFTKGEVLTITITSNTTLTITSNKQSTSVFHINLNGLNATVNSNSVDSIKAIAIGGSKGNSAGGNAYVRSNNGIAAGGGGAGGYINNVGYTGGSAYAYGNNVYAMGGGGGGGGNYRGGKLAGGVGGNAYINGVEQTGYCNWQTLSTGKGGSGTAGSNTSTSGSERGGSGGNGGCGGGCGFMSGYNNTINTPTLGGAGYFSFGGLYEGGSARGGNVPYGGIYVGPGTSGTYPNAMFYSPKGYFVGGASAFGIAGTGGFLGGQGLSRQDARKGTYAEQDATGATGGYSPYGIGGKGGDGSTHYGNGGGSGGKGGDGKLIGGNGGNLFSNQATNVRGVFSVGNGGNGYYKGYKGVFSGSVGNYAGNFVTGSDGTSLTNNMLIGTAPVRGMTPTTSIVIIEYGNSVEDF